MTRPYHATLILLGMAALGMLSQAAIAQEAFVPPEPHPADRYEQVWQKNPFILKTAPVVEEKKSFARDFVLYNAFQLPGGEVTVVLANTKTRETVRLKTKEQASNGMKIRSVMLKDPRKDSYVEVEKNGESAVLRYDDTFQKQLLASKSTRGNRGPGAAGADGADASGQPAVGPNGEPMASPNPALGPGGRPPGQAPAPGPTIRPPLPQRPTPDGAPANSEPASIRPPGPGPGPQRVMPIPQRGTPTPGRRRFFTAPPPAGPPETAQVAP
jgi:hypothetical protein